MRYCGDGHLEIDNNGAEQSLRRIAVLRTAAILTTSITSCKQLHIDSFAYLRNVFQRISAHAAKSVDDLLPDNWKAAQETTQSLPA